MTTTIDTVRCDTGPRGCKGEVVVAKCSGCAWRLARCKAHGADAETARLFLAAHEERCQGGMRHAAARPSERPVVPVDGGGGPAGGVLRDVAAGRDGADGERHPGFIPAGSFVGTGTTIAVIDGRTGEVIDGPFALEAFDIDAFDRPERPKTRADCIDGPRPCPWIGCRHHTQITVNPETGHIKFHFPGVKEGDLDGHPETCSLDVADEGGMTLNEIGESMSLSRERIRQVEVESMGAFKTAARRLKVIDS